MKLDTHVEEMEEFAGLPDHLRPYALAVLSRFMNDCDTWALSRQELVSAIMSLSFRPVLEQEARLNALGLAGLDRDERRHASSTSS